MVYRYAGSSEHVYFHFRHDSSTPQVTMPMVFDLGTHYGEFDDRARRAVGTAGLHPPAASAAVWALLWDSYALCQTQSTVDSLGNHPLVAITIRHIEQRLGGTITVAQLCKEVGVSNGYLTRLFQEQLGTSVSEYIRLRRLQQARHLLTSTTLPIKVIARSVGVPDLQQFNRFIHLGLGAGPREFRRQRGSAR
jgi:transcriptional regulator GlxA family with amidase domain